MPCSSAGCVGRIGEAARRLAHASIMRKGARSHTRAAAARGAFRGRVLRGRVLRGRALRGRVLRGRVLRGRVLRGR
eukprot:4125127-Prymnesium_polylepis.1